MYSGIQWSLKGDILSEVISLIDLPEILEYTLIKSACIEYNQNTEKVYNLYFIDGIIPHFVETHLKEVIKGKKLILLDEDRTDAFLLA